MTWCHSLISIVDQVALSWSVFIYLSNHFFSFLIISLIIYFLYCIQDNIQMWVFLVYCLCKMIKLSKCLADLWNMPGPKSSEWYWSCAGELVSDLIKLMKCKLVKISICFASACCICNTLHADPVPFCMHRHSELTKYKKKKKREISVLEAFEYVDNIRKLIEYNIS